MIDPDTKKSVGAVLLVGVTIVMLLAGFAKAGPAGELFYNTFFYLFGWGYYLFPMVALLVAGTLFLAQSGIFLLTTILGATGFVTSGLGLIDIIFPGEAGLIGGIVGSIEAPFGHIAAIILTVCVAIASLLVALNAKIMLRKPPETDDANEASEAKEAVEASVIVRTADGKKETVVLDTKKTKPKSNEAKEAVEANEAPETNKSSDLAVSYGRTKGTQNYVPPPLDIFKSSTEKPTSGDIRANANIIKRTLESFGIQVEMGEINIGPKVTRYTLKPAEGIKLSRILALNQDLSLALAAHPIRIEAPIPGKSLVGVEVPNKSAAIVRIGTLLGLQDFAKMGPLTFILGRDVTGEPIYADIEKMPHMLIAGATGSGKSVAIHAMIVSLLYRNSPDTLKFIMIDPKRVELSIYNGIPHLIAPVITEGKKSVGVFRWAIGEMERRYETLQKAGVRDIKSYNKSGKDPLPYLVIVVDELADLMSSYGREVETSIVRLAQMARATGIHLVLATQRPSVEVVTGLIKANITARMALQVGSQIDSRTILDAAGAEKLLGGGDMLFISSDFSKPKRIQGAYIGEEEIHAVSDFIMEHNSTVPEDTANAAATLDTINKEDNHIQIENPMKGSVSFDDVPADGDDDELYGDALHVVIEAKKASASLLQRRLKVGYARAARLLDIMEEKGVIGPGDGAKPREVFLDAPEPAINIATFDDNNTEQKNNNKDEVV